MSIRRFGWATAVVAAFGVMGCATFDRPVPAEEEVGLSARDRVVRLQIFLDSVNFGPGVVDGRDGEFTAKALGEYRRVMGRDPDVGGVVPYTTYVITAEDEGRVGAAASGPEDMATRKRLPYASLTELLGERFHTTESFVRKLNPGVELDRAVAGTRVKVPNVARPLRVAKFPSAYPAAVASAVAPRRVVIDLRERLLRVIGGDRLLAVFPITPGSSEHPAPVGEWKILGLAPWPWFRWDDGVLERGVRTEVAYQIPPGVNNPVGILWAGLNKPGVGIHGTPSPETIGRSGSHGCIRLSNWDAATFYTLVPKGTAVTIR